MMRAPGAIALLLVPASLACSTLKDAVRERAANEFGCPEDSIDVEDLGSGGYRATGCEVTATYTCLAGGLRSLCVKEEAVAAPKAEPASTEATTAPVHPPKEVLCAEAFNHVHELSSAWAEWHPDRDARQAPSSEDFLGVCSALSMQQQACLVMPWGRTHRASCVKTLDALAGPDRDRLDGLFLMPPGSTTGR